MITDLPPEIVVEIVPSLDYGDIFALMLCAKSLYIKLFPSLYEEIVLTTLGPYDRPLLARSPRRLTERNRRKFFSALDIGLISDDALGSIKRVTMTDLVSETYISAGNAPERLEIIKQALPMMTKLRHFDLILGQASKQLYHSYCSRGLILNSSYFYAANLPRALCEILFTFPMRTGRRGNIIGPRRQRLPPCYSICAREYTEHRPSQFLASIVLGFRINRTRKEAVITDAITIKEPPTSRSRRRFRRTGRFLRSLARRSSTTTSRIPHSPSNIPTEESSPQHQPRPFQTARAPPMRRI